MHTHSTRGKAQIWIDLETHVNLTKIVQAQYKFLWIPDQMFETMRIRIRNTMNSMHSQIRFADYYVNCHNAWVRLKFVWKMCEKSRNSVLYPWPQHRNFVISWQNLRFIKWHTKTHTRTHRRSNDFTQTHQIIVAEIENQNKTRNHKFHRFSSSQSESVKENQRAKRIRICEINGSISKRISNRFRMCGGDYSRCLWWRKRMLTENFN